MPSYFRFLTVMAFHVFLREKVDVAVLEVGIGGEYDCTNVITRPIVCGIASIGMDHENILGDSIQKIAWNKSGIMKTGVPVFTIPTQNPSVMKVLAERAEEKKCDLKVVPLLTMSDFTTTKLQGNHQYENASLAVALAFEWLKKVKMVGEGYHMGGGSAAESKYSCLPPWVIDILANTRWPGRSHKFVMDRYKNITWYADGAHTVESIDACLSWYHQQNKDQEKKCVLLFSPAAGRDAGVLIKKLVSCTRDIRFVEVIFTRKITGRPDSKNKNVKVADSLSDLEGLKERWLEAVPDFDPSKISMFTNIQDSIEMITKKYGNPSELKNMKDNENTDVIVTGSLHLVGGVLDVTKTPLIY
ncbi:Folylpolyglutamate synthase, mitochondrial [Zancudomyces culisetae]|uniref:tetrahydrofolate synthase n=1 Tax=Zancudomyces culisetae TaxID=1213189 RepID=A0A1R1PQA0_ZANCU|nr:Folylpolyglutamate synthase, mitochondrial [Zancudomyces culisetae]|eukprot:OMH83052.1 Folylpolyglutamate synthase, mitochondrial [Zancudomyces culisetae]